MPRLRIGIHRNQLVFVGPMRKEEKRTRSTTYNCPFDATHKVEIGGTEGEGATIEQDASPAFVYLPESASVGTILAPIQEVTMLIHSSELQYSVLIDDEFLIHGYILLLL